MNELNRIYQEHKNNPVAWILVGLAALILIGSSIWPLFIIAPGAMFIYAAYNGGRSNAGLIFPGLIIAGTGTILLYQSITGHWESWAYIWVLYPVFVGMGLQFNGKRTGNEQEVKTGKEMVKYGLMALAGLALFFELIIFGGIMAWLLLAAGLGLLWWNGNIKLGDEERDEAYRQKVREFVTDKRKHVNVNGSKPEEEFDKPEISDPYSTLASDTRQRINEALEEAPERARKPRKSKVVIPINVEEDLTAEPDEEQPEPFNK